MVNRNPLKANAEKYHLLANTIGKIQSSIGGTVISKSIYEKFLVIKIDNKLKFKPHARSFCKKASQKLKAFTRMQVPLKFLCSSCLDVSLPKIYVINCIHERALTL